MTRVVCVFCGCLHHSYMYRYLDPLLGDVLLLHLSQRLQDATSGGDTGDEHSERQHQDQSRLHLECRSSSRSLMEPGTSCLVM